MKKAIFIISIIILGWSCLKIEEASEIPSLEYKSYALSEGKDTLDNPIYKVVLTVEFEDGDGDIGYTETDTVQSLFLNVYKIKNGIESDTLKNVGFKIPYVEPVKSVRIVKGEIELKHELKKTIYKENDTIYYDMYIEDRAKNKSNIIESPKIKLNISE